MLLCKGAVGRVLANTTQNALQWLMQKALEWLKGFDGHRSALNLECTTRQIGCVAHRGACLVNFLQAFGPWWPGVVGPISLAQFLIFFGDKSESSAPSAISFLFSYVCIVTLSLFRM